MQRRKDNKGRVLNKGESQRKDGTYMYRYNDINKERKSVYARTLNDLRKKEAEINKNQIDGIYSTEWSFNELFDRYIEQKPDSAIKERVKYKYKSEYDRWVKNTWFGKKKLKSIVKSDVVLFYKELKAKGYSDGTIKVVHKYINGTLNMAYEDDLIRKNFAIHCIDPYNNVSKRRALTKEETNKFLTTAEALSTGENYLLGFKLMFLTGLRIGEVTGLTWNDVDMKNRIIDVNHQFVIGDKDSRTTYHIDTPKTFNGKRKVPMSNDVYELFKDIRAKTYFNSIKFGVNVDGYSGFVLHTRTGLPILTARFNEYAKKIVQIYNDTHEDKLPNVTCHICRHTFCTRMAELNISPNALQKIMGHGSYRTTSNVYITIEDDFVNEEFYKAMRQEDKAM